MSKLKKIICICISAFMFLPLTVFAARAQDLMDTLERGGITPSVEDYKETKEQAVIYLFWSDTCGHCHEELEYINSILPEYKDKIKMRSYEGSNSENFALQQKVGQFFKLEKYNGFPLTVIGDKTFYGFGEDYKEEMIEAIEKLYNSTEKYDVFDELEKKDEENEISPTPMYILVGIVSIGIVGFLVYITKKK